jgi:hypothetical protein
VPASRRPLRIASFIDPQPRNAIRLVIAPSLQFPGRHAGPASTFEPKQDSQRAHRIVRGYAPLWGHSVGTTSLRVRVTGRHGDVCQAPAGYSRFTHFPAAARRCLFFFDRLPATPRQSTFPACIQEKPAKHPYSVASVLSASQGASDGAGPAGPARRRPVAGVFPQLLLQDRPALHSLTCGLSLPSAAASGSQCAGRAPRARQR